MRETYNVKTSTSDGPDEPPDPEPEPELPSPPAAQKAKSFSAAMPAKFVRTKRKCQHY